MSDQKITPKPTSTTYELNQTTQKMAPQPIFGNWNVIAKAWYFVAPSESIGVGQVQSFSIHGQRLVVFRGQDQKIRILDAFCPHMGADLSIGKVSGNQIQCFFHHWKFDGEGQCMDIPCSPKNQEFKQKAKTQSYAVVEKYKSIWVWPDRHADNDLPDFPLPMGEDPVVWFGKPIFRTCHHHVNMINGLDPQHLKTVHNISIEMDVSSQMSGDGQIVDFTLRGQFPQTRLGKIARYLFGPEYSYGMRYINASIGLLTTMRGLKFRGKGFSWPDSNMIFAYLPVQEGVTKVQPMFISRKRSGVLGWLITRGMLLAAYMGFQLLTDEDGAIYETIRFSPRNLLPIDHPVLKYVNYVNKLKPSLWSKKVDTNLV